MSQFDKLDFIDKAKISGWQLRIDKSGAIIGSWRPTRDTVVDNLNNECYSITEFRNLPQKYWWQNDHVYADVLNRWVDMTGKPYLELDFGDTPIPIPGKGENSWDCGDNALYAVSSAEPP